MTRVKTRVFVTVRAVKHAKLAAVFACLIPLLAATCAHAVIVFRDGGRNVSPPTGSLAQSGWQYQGLWNGFTGTVIGPHQFVTATHVGGQVGALFIIGGKKYPATGWTNIPNSDLTIWWVEGTFASVAPLYEKQNEVNKQILLFGRGTSRGPALRVDSETRGWRWGATDHKLSWGKNKAAGIADFGAASAGPGDEGSSDNWLGSIDNQNKPMGEMLVWGFVKNKDLDTGMVSGGDSGGGVFIKDGATWKLAGIIHGTDAGFRRTRAKGAGDAPFRAALFEARGLFRSGDGSLIGGLNSDDENKPLNRCSIGYACRISTHAPAIKAALASGPHSRYTKHFLAFVLSGIIALIGLLAWASAAIAKRTMLRREARDEAAEAF